MRRKLLRKIIRLIVIVVALSLLAIIFSNWRVNKVSGDSLYTDAAKIPEMKVGLVLGTSKYLKGGDINRYFKYRIEAAASLYHMGLVKYILVSGDNGHKSYNEPRQMLQELIRAGVPQEAIVLDFAGFRTFDSVIRAKEVFGQDSIIVISQKFQNQRAVYIGKHKNMTVIGYNARDVNKREGFRIRVREHFARVKLLLDVYVLNTKPKFLGEKEMIGT